MLISIIPLDSCLSLPSLSRNQRSTPRRYGCCVWRRFFSLLLHLQACIETHASHSGSDKMLSERRASLDHEHTPFMPHAERTLDAYPPKPSRSTVRSAPRRLLGRLFRSRSPYHPVENGENEELMALNGETIDVHIVDKPREAPSSHVDWTED